MQWKDLNGTNQQFKLAKSSNGYVRLVNRFSGMAVGVRSAAKADGGGVVQNRDRGGADQQWQLVPAGSVGGGAGTPTAAVAAFRKPDSERHATVAFVFVFVARGWWQQLGEAVHGQ